MEFGVDLDGAQRRESGGREIGHDPFVQRLLRGGEHRHGCGYGGAADAGGLQGAGQYAGAGGGDQVGGGAHVVGVGVGEHDLPQLVRPAAEPGQCAEDGGGRAGDAGVDRGVAVVGEGDEVHVPDGEGELPDGGGDRGECVHGPDASRTGPAAA